jgi:hypothetical protein
MKDEQKSWRLVIGDWRLAIGDWRLAIGGGGENSAMPCLRS